MASTVCLGQSPRQCVLRLARRTLATASVASKDASQPTTPLRLPKDRSVRFGFSAGGLLFPFYVGVCRGLEEAGYLSANTKLAGALTQPLARSFVHEFIRSFIHSFVRQAHRRDHSSPRA